MSLKKYEDFLSLNTKQLINYLSVRGLNTAGRKVELVARAFSANELGLGIIQSSEEQQKTLEENYAKKLSNLQLPDPKSIDGDKLSNDVTQWPSITLGNIFAYILKKNEFDADYIGKYKDQKAYSFFDSGFVGEIKSYKISSKKNISFLYCDVRASQAIHENKNLWIITKVAANENTEILSAWCSCMAGAYESCNHIIATLYKLEYASSRGWCNPACTDIACEWNKATKKEITPKLVSELYVRKKMGTSAENKPDEVSREEMRTCHLIEFDPRIPSHRSKNESHINQFLGKLKSINSNAVIFYSTVDEKSSNSELSEAFMENIANETLTNNPNANESNLMKSFMQNITLNLSLIEKIEKSTRDQNQNQIWYEVRRGRLTASKHHEIFTKVNSLSHQRSAIKAKTTPLVNSIINKSKDISKLSAIKWGLEHEEDALKSFYASEISKHNGFKTVKSGLVISQQKPFLAASPDGILYCKCHGISTIEIKCPYSMRDKKIKDCVKECSFLFLNKNGEIIIKKSHKYYTQVISQMALTKTNQAYFVVWTLVDHVVISVEFDKVHWEKVSVNLAVFFKTFVCPALLGLKPLTFCGKCDQVLLEEAEIDSSEEKELNSILCDICSIWYHYKCESINPDELRLLSLAS